VRDGGVVYNDTAMINKWLSDLAMTASYVAPSSECERVGTAALRYNGNISSLPPYGDQDPM